MRLCGDIGVNTNELLDGEITGPPQLNEYPVDPVGVDTIKPSDQYELIYVPSRLVLTLIIDVVSFLTTLISFRAYGKDFSEIVLQFVVTFNKDLFSETNFLLKIFIKDFSRFSFFVLAKKPNLPVFIPMIGRFKFLTNSIDLKKVPSPPILINMSKFSVKSL